MHTIEGRAFTWRGRISSTTSTVEALAAKKKCAFSEAVDVHEKLIDDNNLRPIAFLAMGLRLSRAVAQILVPGLGSGTGFLIAPGVLMTNNHVLPSADAAGAAIARFNYETDVFGRLQPSYYFRCNPSRLFVTHEALDFTLVWIDEEPGNEFGIIPLGRQSPGIGERVNIIQHPGGEPKQIALVDNEIAFADANVVQYLTDTLPGSSGAPVFDDNWRVVALHHSGGWIPEPTTQSTHFRNEGIHINAIVDQLVQGGLVA